ncbi:uncharacterized protein LAJ45_10387 [Morchella importuna]|uniref:uncharacterized protein n=1 Tax=Morchella importuna TaxID=1174673 RepID=UPI001E8D71DA|nr:uncharacterized protein LAJ45_10387 [Morchella importuna]KAH8145587.1 hypothetical protein LAJ45_10387 [Morchella importuna]
MHATLTMKITILRTNCVEGGWLIFVHVSYTGLRPAFAQFKNSISAREEASRRLSRMFHDVYGSISKLEILRYPLSRIDSRNSRILLDFQLQLHDLDST